MRRRVTETAVVVAGVLVAAGLILGACAATGSGGPGPASGGPFSSNGEQIYYTATSERGDVITANWGNGGMMGGGGMMGSGMLPCVRCHGRDGRGGRVWIMMRTFVAPDIRYATLTGMMEDHPPYTDVTIKGAITQGIDPAGEPLDSNMPRWQMSDADADDVVQFLKTLS